jgi:hypothetical protein
MSKMEEPKIMQTKTWEQFKDEMDYFLSVLKQDNLTEETKREINNAMQLMVRQWANPVMIVPHGSVIKY